MTDLPDLINWRRLSDRLTLSGQPTEKQLLNLQKMGITQIVNLGPHTNEGALPDETASVAALGMNYIYIPVDFDNPTDSDFQEFCEALEQTKNEKTHVHCIYNARVTAFFYRHAAEGFGGSPEAAKEMMDGIWRPGSVWGKFIGYDENEYRENQYAGYEY